jgi:hypothetical protein
MPVVPRARITLSVPLTLMPSLRAALRREERSISAYTAALYTLGTRLSLAELRAAVEAAELARLKAQHDERATAI